MYFQICSLLVQIEGKKKGLFWKGERRGATLQDYHLVDIRDEKVSSFVKFEIILSLIKLKSQLKSIFLDFRVLESKFVKVFMSVLKRHVNSFLNFALFFFAMTHNSSVNFKFYFGQKDQSPNFDTFKCSGENLPNLSCHFSNHQLVFLQNLHSSSVSWKITPLYLFSSNNIYFAKKELIKVKRFETFECPGQNLSNPYVNFDKTSSLLSKFCVPLQFHER